MTRRRPRRTRNRSPARRSPVHRSPVRQTGAARGRWSLTPRTCRRATRSAPPRARRRTTGGIRGRRASTTCACRTPRRSRRRGRRRSRRRIRRTGRATRARGIRKRHRHRRHRRTHTESHRQRTHPTHIPGVTRHASIRRHDRTTAKLDYPHRPLRDAATTSGHRRWLSSRHSRFLLGTRESETPTPAIFYHAAARFRSEIQTKTPCVSKFFDGSHRFISTTANPRTI
jgi:hypothetical protein